ncbi:MAG: hypothetical protein VCA55_02020 [Verrucomicrobiales bacterium]|jgi:hypothetical protein
MKIHITIFVLAGMAVVRNSAAQAPVVPGNNAVVASAEEVGVLPQEKEGMIKAFILKQEERNPFADRTKGDNGQTAEDSQSEDSRIRLALESFSVSGIARGQDGYKAQLGGIILSEGNLIPRLIPGQADDLRVTKITPELVEITWVADEEADKPRKITLEIDLVPRVGVLLPTASKNGSNVAGQLVYAAKEEADPE